MFAISRIYASSLTTYASHIDVEHLQFVRGNMHIFDALDNYYINS
jgi:hypothetical protein